VTQQLDSLQLLSLLDSSKLLVVCGSGGVGKTTMSAALGALAATHLSKKVLVLTVDPARRLADALGLQAIGNAVVQVDAKAFNEAGVVPQGQLFAAMIDTKASWDDLIHRHAPTPAIAQRVLANALYTNLTERFVHSHDYIAMERLYDVYQSGAYDLVVVDTPPSRNALDVLDAPKRMRDFFDSRLLQLLTTPAQSRVVSLMSKPFFQVADRILGARFLSSITEFFTLFRTMEKGFVERANKVESVLRHTDTKFAVVTTLEVAPAFEAEYLLAELQSRSFSLAALIANRVLPLDIAQQTSAALANDRSLVGPETLQAAAASAGLPAPSAEQCERVLDTLWRAAQDVVAASVVEQSRLEKLSDSCLKSGANVLTAQYVSGEITDMKGIVALGESLSGR
jgi:anion-transporting  ArsA/GET3 family ATPase